MPRSKFTDAAKAECLRNLRLGLPRKTAAALAGWHHRTFEDYLRDGRTAIAEGRMTNPKAVFVADVMRAEATCKRNALAIVMRAAQGVEAVFDDRGNVVRAERVPEWQAAIWLLERRFPADFGKKRLNASVRVEFVADDTSAASLAERARAANDRHLRAVPDEQQGNDRV